MEPKIKISQNPRKVTNPGIKKIVRFYNGNDRMIGDLLTQHDEPVPSGGFVRAHHPMYDYMKRSTGHPIPPRNSWFPFLSMVRRFTIHRVLQRPENALPRISHPSRRSIKGFPIRTSTRCLCRTPCTESKRNCSPTIRKGRIPSSGFECARRFTERDRSPRISENSVLMLVAFEDY